MKKYNSMFVCSLAAAAISLFSAMIVFSLASRVPVFIDEEISNTIFTGGKNSLFIKFSIIALPVLFFIFSFFSFICYKKARKEKGLCTKLEASRKNFSPIHIFIICSALITIFSLIYVCVHRNSIWDYHFHNFGTDAYMDFFNHITYARYPSETYAQTEHACFPALAYVFYYVFSLILPSNSTVKFDASMTSPYATLTYVMYSTVLCMVLLYLVKKLLNYNGRTVACVIGLVLLSNFFLTTIERGNSVLIVLILLLGALVLRNSEKSWHRELALILIAVAAGFKIYPAIFGLLYLLEKRYKEAVRLIVYGIVFFVVPFAFFGGIDGFMQFLQNQVTVQESDYATLQSIKAAVHYFALEFTDDANAFNVLADILPILFVAVNMLAFVNKKTVLWEKLYLLCAIMVFFPSWSGSYTPIYFVIPMLLFFNEYKNISPAKSEKLYYYVIAVGFAVAFSMIVFVSSTGELWGNIAYVSLYLINTVIVVRSTYLFIASKVKTAPHLEAL